MSSPPPCSSLAHCEFERFEYWAGNPEVEIVHGHIYVVSGIEAQSVPLDIVASFSDQSASPGGTVDCHLPLYASSCVTLASSVPCCMPAPEFLEFLGAFGDDTHRLFRHVRVLYGRSPEEYLVAIWLVSPQAAAQLVERFDGRPYNSIEPGVCRMHRVVGCAPPKDVQRGAGGAFAASTGGGSSPISAASTVARKPSPSSSSMVPGPGPSSPQRSSQGQLRAPVPQSAAAAAAASRNLIGISPSRGPCRSPVHSPASVPVPAMHLDCWQLAAPEEELFHVCCGATSRAGPKEGTFCSICREDIEESPGSYQLTELGGAVPLTILCGHTFHARCLSHWCDSNCPLCRFQQHPSQSSSCDVCGQTDGIYICLVCSFIGCMDADGNGHAQQHYADTNHAYALEVSTQKVWDFAGNGYVHRLLFNHEDGKMVEHSGIPGSSASSAGSGLAFDMVGGWGLGNFRWADASEFCCDGLEDAGLLSAVTRRTKKQDLVVSDFNALLASQMSAQQQYFEERRREQDEQHSKELSEIRCRLEAAAFEAEDAQRRLADALERNRLLEREAAETASDEEVMRGQMKKLKELNKKISNEQAIFEKQADNTRERELARRRSRNLEVEELQQQIRDLELYVQMRKKLQVSTAPGDLDNAHMVVTEAEPGRGRGGRRGRRK